MIVLLFNALAYNAVYNACLLIAVFSNAVCMVHLVLFFSIDFCKYFFFSCFVLVYCHIGCLFHVFICIMHSAFNLLVFPNSMFLVFFDGRSMCSLEK